jgi:hypothetical protein
MNIYDQIEARELKIPDDMSYFRIMFITSGLVSHFRTKSWLSLLSILLTHSRAGPSTLTGLLRTRRIDELAAPFSVNDDHDHD